MTTIFNLFLVLACKLLVFVLVTSGYSFEDPNTDFYYGKDKAIKEPRKVGWIDPYDMSYEPKPNPYQEYSTYGNKKHAEGTHEKCNIKCEVNLQRLVNSFLHSTSLLQEEEGLYDIRLVSTIAARDLKVLKQFAEYDKSKVGMDVRDITEIFHKIFAGNEYHNHKRLSLLDKLSVWLSTFFYKMAQSPELTVVSSVMAMLIGTWWFFYKTRSYRLALFSLFLIMFFAGFGFTWVRLYEEAEVERYVSIKLHGEIPYHCSGNGLAWYEHMFYRLFGVNCLEFYKIRDVRPIVKISPTDVLSETLSSMVIKPATNIGKAYGNFCHNVLEHLPWWLKPMGVPMVFVLPPLFFIIVMALFLDYRFSISLTGFHLVPTWYGGRRAHPGIGDGDYVKDVPRDTSNLHPLFSESTGPMFLLNWSGLQKLVSSDMLVENKSESNKEEDSKQSETKDDQGVQEKDDSSLQKEVLNVTPNKVRPSIEYREHCTPSEPSSTNDKSDPCCSQSISTKKDQESGSFSSSRESEMNVEK